MKKLNVNQMECCIGGDYTGRQCLIAGTVFAAGVLACLIPGVRVAGAFFAGNAIVQANDGNCFGTGRFE